MVTSLQKPMSVKSKMECISSSSAAHSGPPSGHWELARQKEKLKEVIIRSVFALAIVDSHSYGTFTKNALT